MGLLKFGARLPVVAAVACGIVVSFAARPQDSAPLVGTVTGVIDGDTIKVQLAIGPVIVRLANIDAPEAVQPGGRAATQALHDRLLTKDVSLRSVTREEEDHLVAVVYLGDENINGWMVKQGHAWAYRGYTREPDYCVWENAARSLRRGLWADKYWTAPWDWRMSQRDSMHFITDYSTASTAGCIRQVSEAANFDD
jgi:micrococcal nuclease